MNRRAAKNRIAALFRRYLSVSPARARSLIPPALTSGKLYEAFVLAYVLRELLTHEGLRGRLSGPRGIALKSSPGPINRGYPCIELLRNDSVEAEVWTDVEFTSLSCDSQGRAASNPEDYHELDILVADAASQGRPVPGAIWLGVECKHTRYSKGMLREILGVRRELSLLDHPRPTRFGTWPASAIPANPACCLLVCSSDPAVSSFLSPAAHFGIHFHHLPI